MGATEGCGDLPASDPYSQMLCSAWSLLLQIKSVQLLESGWVRAGCGVRGCWGGACEGGWTREWMLERRASGREEEENPGGCCLSLVITFIFRIISYIQKSCNHSCVPFNSILQTLTFPLVLLTLLFFLSHWAVHCRRDVPYPRIFECVSGKQGHFLASVVKVGNEHSPVCHPSHSQRSDPQASL